MKPKARSWRPLFHLTPPGGWMNDPNGFSYVDGRYELFYQHHGLSGDTSHLHWRLASSTDLLSYVDQGIMLSPRFHYEGIGAEGGGCFSGSRYKKDYLLYAAASSTDGQTVALAKWNGFFFEQIEKNPIALPPSFVDPFSFRDPFYFAYEGKDYFLIGASSKDKKGMLLLYELRGEEALYHRIFYEDATIEMFECPTLLFLAGKAVLVLSPIGLRPEGLLHQNLTNNVALIGHLDANLRFERESGYLDLDSGFDYYAAQGISSPEKEEEAILVAWLCLWNKDFAAIPTGKHDGYIGTMALPRTLSLKDGKLVQKPIPFLEKHFKQAANIHMGEGSRIEVPLSSRLSIANVDGDFSLALLSNPHGAVRLEFDSKAKAVSLMLIDERAEASRLYAGTKRQLLLSEGLKDIEIYLDSYVIELSFNGGLHWMSAMYYPHLLAGEKAQIILSKGSIDLREEHFIE